MGRRLCPPLDLVKPDLERRVVNEQLMQKKKHDAHDHAREFEIGNAVFARNWVHATVTARTGPVSYQVEVEEAGLSWGRHIDLIRARLNPEIMVPVVTPADSEKPTKESTPRSHYPTIPQTKLSYSPSPPNAESPRMRVRLQLRQRTQQDACKAETPS